MKEMEMVSSPRPPAACGVPTGTGRHRVQITYFLWVLIGSQTSSGVGLRSDGPLDRMRQRSVLSRELWIQN